MNVDESLFFNENDWNDRKSRNTDDIIVMVKLMILRDDMKSEVSY